jgi:hypothetical protein
VVHREPLSGSAEARHHLIAHHENAVLRAELANALEVASGRDEHAVGSADRLEKERRDRMRAFELDYFLEHRQRFVCRIPAAREPMIRIQHVNHSGHPRLGAPPARIARERHRAVRSTVIRAVPGKNLVAPRIGPRQLDRVLVGIRTAVGEEEDVDVSGRELRELRTEPAAHLRRHERVRVGQRRRLLLNGANDPLVVVSGIDAHQLAVEIEVALPIGRPEVDPLGARHGDGIHRRLRGPLEQCVLSAQIDDFCVREDRVGGRQREDLTVSRLRSMLQSVWGARFSMIHP